MCQKIESTRSDWGFYAQSLVCVVCHSITDEVAVPGTRTQAASIFDEPTRSRQGPVASERPINQSVRVKSQIEGVPAARGAENRCNRHELKVRLSPLRWIKEGLI